MRWKKITLVGVGLLGGSLGLALRKRRLAQHVVGFVRRKASVKECQSLGIADEVTLDLRRAVDSADLVVLCTPIAQMRQLTEQLLPALKRGAIVTDVGSVKGTVVRDLGILVAKVGGYFVGSHPMAGSEKTGAAAARADLFVGAVCVVTPTSKTHKPALRNIEALWRSVGAEVLRLSPIVHDSLVSRSSHLPHVVAAALANHVLDPAHPREQSVLCANGFRDTTRIASSSPEMWRDIAVANRANIARALETVMGDLQRFKRSLLRADSAAISRFFEKAKQRRDRWTGRARASSE